MHLFNKSLRSGMNERRELILKKIERIKKRQSESTQELKEKIDSRKREEGYQEKVINEDRTCNSMKP